MLRLIGPFDPARSLLIGLIQIKDTALTPDHASLCVSKRSAVVDLYDLTEARCLRMFIVAEIAHRGEIEFGDQFCSLALSGQDYR